MKQNKGLRPEVLAEMWQASGLKFKILFTLGMLFVVRFGIAIPVDGLNNALIAEQFSKGNLLSFIDMFAGGGLAKFSIFALGIIPYINASIIMQLMSSVIPKLEELQKEGGEAGRRQIAQITRYLTVILSAVQSVGLAIWLWRSNVVYAYPANGPTPIFFIINTSLILICGSIVIMWIGELMTEHGIGNGASLLIFVGIVAALPNYISQTRELIQGNPSMAFGVALLVLIYLLIIVMIVYASEGARKIPVQSAKRQVGNRVYGGRATYLPFRINQGGVMPIIFASSVLLFPATISQFAPNNGWLATINQFLAVQPGYGIFYVSLIFFFTFFYASMILNPQEIASNLKRYGSYIPGYRPGRPTAEYLETIITRITFCGALFLAVIVIIPMVAESATNVTTLSRLGSTALLIMVGVAVDLFNQLQTHLMARQYDGFMS